MRRAIDWILFALGLVFLGFGLACLNYTKLGGVEHHRELAASHGWPPPSVTINRVGMSLTPLGAGLLGAGLARRTIKYDRSGARPKHPPRRE